MLMKFASDVTHSLGLGEHIGYLLNLMVIPHEVAGDIEYTNLTASLRNQKPNSLCCLSY